ncbi:MAG: alanine--tRNA ligase [Victivallales bacterium]|nr:alanine--tRNA ligase [Victivallales bacterium]
MIQKMTAAELRRKYIEFFKAHGHAEIKSASLIPENDPTCLFTTAGMHPLVPYLLGAKHPSGTRLVDVQKCLRTGDIDEVGDPFHLTFFEMLGNWSLGDYFKKEAISMSFEFLTKELGFRPEEIKVTCFAGDENAPRDTEAAAIWMSLGILEKNVYYLPKEDNWWGPAGQTGPCGPDTEIFVPIDKPDCGPDCGPACGCGKWVEIWNNVFMQYNKQADGTLAPLGKPNVDTGMGVERVTAFMQGVKSAYETELFSGIFAKIQELSKNAEANAQNRSARVVAEHLRASTFLIADGVKPSNVDQGYVLRRLIRRAIREARKLGITERFTSKVADVVIAEYSPFYPELKQNEKLIHDELDREEEQFAKALENGSREFYKVIEHFPPQVQKKVISGRKAFDLYETYGFPLELTEEMARENGFTVDVEGFKAAYAKHQEQSRAGAEQKFKGGLADHSEATAALHTATHLLHKALRLVLQYQCEQSGSNITAERLRFDFTYDQKMTPEQIKAVEDLVNEQIQKDLKVTCEEVPLEEAHKRGAIGLFGSKYGEVVKLYGIGDFSLEICGGPHVTHTGCMGHFKILKEESSSRGIRRIKAILERPEGTKIEYK